MGLRLVRKNTNWVMIIINMRERLLNVEICCKRKVHEKFPKLLQQRARDMPFVELFRKIMFLKECIRSTDSCSIKSIFNGLFSEGNRKGALKRKKNSRKEGVFNQAINQS